MRVVQLALFVAAIYAAIITAMYIAQTWLLFPTTLAGLARVQLPASAQRPEIRNTGSRNPGGRTNPSSRTARRARADARRVWRERVERGSNGSLAARALSGSRGDCCPLPRLWAE